MDFYCASYKTEKFTFFKKWEDNYCTGELVVIAGGLDEAIGKINECLKSLESEKKRYVLTSEVRLCKGIRFLDDGPSCSFTHPVY